MVLNAEGSVLLLIDLQQRLMPAIHDSEVVIARAARLAEAARLLGVPIRATQQYPAGLGATVPELAGYPAETLDKTACGYSASGGTVGPRPAGFCSVARTGTSSRRAAAASRTARASTVS